ncbi:hypothetical protein ABEF95_007654 [Exophiala dermatitidis]
MTQIPDSNSKSTDPNTSTIFPCRRLLGPVLLLTFLIWDFFERRLSERNKSKYQPFPLPSPSERKYHSSNVSIIIPTVDTDKTFRDSLCGFLRNKPLEIIVVATESEKYHVQDLVHNATVQQARVRAGASRTALKILTVSHANKRDQLVTGINASTGAIVALVDDDAFWPRENLLLSLLAPFQRDDVGLVGCPVTSYLPNHRKSNSTITPWEVAAIRLRGTRHGSMKSAYATDGGINFCVSGVTMLLRGEILRDPEFQYALTHDFWMGKKQNSGDDTFITRWVLFQHHRHGHRQNEHHHHNREVRDQFGKTLSGHLNSPSPSTSTSPDSGAVSVRRQWKLGMQLTPSSEVSTSIMPDARFAGQLKRWYRSGLRHRLQCLFFEPGFVAMFKTCPYMTRKMVEAMLNPVLLMPLRLFAVYETCLVWPWLGLLVLIWKFSWYTLGLINFVNMDHPYTKKYWWAAVLVDHLYLVSDWYCWMTLGTEAWMTRRKVDSQHDHDHEQDHDDYADENDDDKLDDDDDDNGDNNDPVVSPCVQHEQHAAPGMDQHQLSDGANQQD